MGLIEINWRPERRELRQFAAISLAGFGVLGLVLAWRLGALSGSGRWAAPVALWIAGAAVGALGLVLPRAVRPVYVVLMAAALPIGWALSHVVLAVLYYGCVTPIGLVFRLIGRDPLCRGFEPNAETYWVERPQAAETARYFRQF